MDLAFTIDAPYLPWCAVAIRSCLDHCDDDVTIHVRQASSPDPLAGSWINENPQGNISRVVVRRDRGRLIVHQWGSCRPVDCDAGEVAELLVRLVLSLALSPDSVLGAHDHDGARRLARRYLVPGLHARIGSLESRRPLNGCAGDGAELLEKKCEHAHGAWKVTRELLQPLRLSKVDQDEFVDSEVRREPDLHR